MASTSVGLEFVNGDSVTLLPGDPVCFKAAGVVQRARADSQVRAVVFGVVLYGGSPTNKVTVVQVGLAWWDSSPALTPGAIYYLGSTGGLTSTPPSTPGESVVEVGIASEVNGLHVLPRRPVLL